MCLDAREHARHMCKIGRVQGEETRIPDAGCRNQDRNSREAAAQALSGRWVGMAEGRCGVASLDGMAKQQKMSREWELFQCRWTISQ